MLWGLEVGILRLYFRVDLESKDKLPGSIACTEYSGVLTFLRDGGMDAPGGTEKHRPGPIIECCLYDNKVSRFSP